MGYPDVKLTNSTPYKASGHISFAACSGNDFNNLAPNDSQSFSRGACLLTKITATVNGQDATPYESSGTSYSQYAIIVQGTGFAVTRVVN
jgi:hypothetical protein